MNARDVHTRRNEGVSNWVVGAKHIVATVQGDKGLDIAETEESHARTQAALDVLWPCAGEMFPGDEVE